MNTIKKEKKKPAHKKEKKKPPHRPLKYGEETIVYRRRVPKSSYQKVADAVENILKKKVV